MLSVQLQHEEKASVSRMLPMPLSSIPREPHSHPSEDHPLLSNKTLQQLQRFWHTGLHWISVFPLISMLHLHSDFKISHSFQTYYHLAIQQCKSLTPRVLDMNPKFRVLTPYLRTKTFSALSIGFISSLGITVLFQKLLQDISSFESPSKINECI